MQEHVAYFEAPKRKPSPPVETERHGERYEQQVVALTRQFIFDDAALNSVQRQITALRRTPVLEHVEGEQHKLEGLEHLLKGIEAQEAADLYFTGAWQAALIRQPAGDGTRKPPEALTREDVKREFNAFPFREQMENAEQTALGAYQGVLGSGVESFQTSVNTKISREDVRVLVNDLSVRRAERNPDDEARKKELLELDQALRELIDDLPEEEWGKRFELEEMYLLRRLIHAADTGHLASVSHGTPREDLRPDKGSVDVRLTAAGDVFALQMKTYRGRVSSETRRMQQEQLEHAERRLYASDTHLVVLQAESVGEAYEKAARHSGRAHTSRVDKYAALQPVTDVVDEHGRACLLMLLGLTEADFQEERAAFEQKVAERQQWERELSAKREEEERREQEVRERIAALAREEEERAADALARHAASVERDRVVAQEERKAAEAAKGQTLAERRTRKQEDREAVERAAAARAEEERRILEEKRLKEERRLKREQREREAPDWPPKALTNLGNATVLKNFGLLPEEWNDDIRLFLDAKKKFIGLFAKPKKKNAPGMETDKPNTLFEEAFPTRQSLESPTGDDVRRIRALLGKE